MIKIGLNYDTFRMEVYVRRPFTVDDETLKNMVRVAASRFRTHCIVNNKSINIPHFINWMKKNYPGIYIDTHIDVVDEVFL